MKEKLEPRKEIKNLQKYEVLDEPFYKQITNVIFESRKHIYSVINSDLIKANWKIGKMIDEKQKRLERAEYGERLITELSQQMTKDFGNGYSKSNLFLMRKFYRTFKIFQTVSGKLSWSHYIYLISINNEDARNFYYQEAIKNSWSVRQLAREIHNISYERYILGNKNYAIIQETADKAKQEEDQEGEDTHLVVKEPLFFDFVGIKPGHEYFESDLEQAIIEHIEAFLLELGRGYSFIARQKRLDIGDSHFYVDLVLYNIIERCYVLIDLKRGALTHKDIGQMQMYVNYFTDNCMIEGDNPPVGMILCAEKDDLVIKYTLGSKNRQVRAYKYVTTLDESETIKEEAEKYLNSIKKTK